MLIMSLSDFIGANLQLHPKRLPAGVGVNTVNLMPGSADLRGWGAASAVHTLTGLAQQQISIYRMGRDTPSDTSYWLSSVNDVDYVRAPIAGDTTDRTYYTGETEPRVTDNVIGIAGAPYPTAYRLLGVPPPPNAMTAVDAGTGSGSAETRAYLDTFVTDKGEESQPNANPVSVTTKTDGTVNISNLAQKPAGAYGINRRRIYVSNGGEFKLFLEQTDTITTASDNGTVRNDVLPSGGSTSKPAWLQPPSGLKGLIELWNGMLGGFLPKSYCVCFPYKGWAWPLEYQRPTFDTIVGTGKWQQNWLILTTGKPRLVTGSSPASLSDLPVPLNEGCVSKRSIVDVGHGVCWASNNGLCYMGQSGPRVLTKGIMRPKQWQALVPSTIIGARYTSPDGQGDYYFGFYNDGSRKGFMIDPADPRGIIFLEQGAYGVFQDTVSGNLYIADSSFAIRKWDAGSALTVTHKTGEVRHPYETNAGWGMVIAESYPVTFKVWGDGVLRHTQTVADEQPFPLPDQYLARDFQVEVSGVGPIQGAVLAEDVSDLP